MLLGPLVEGLVIVRIAQISIHAPGAPRGFSHASSVQGWPRGFNKACTPRLLQDFVVAATIGDLSFEKEQRWCAEELRESYGFPGGPEVEFRDLALFLRIYKQMRCMMRCLIYADALRA